MKHTPGPWFVVTDDGSVGSVRASNGVDVAQAQQTHPLREDLYATERKANAKLIAAAPELLYALQQIIGDLPSKRDWLDPTIERYAKDAVAKATVREG